MALKKRLDQLPAILGGDIENNDLMYLVHENENAETGYDSKKTTAADVGRKLLGGIEYVSELSNFPSGKQNGFDALEYLREFLIGQLPVITTSPSPIANFNTDLALPLISCNIEIKPKQASGTPTPSSPLPISGTDTVIVTQTGKNLIQNKTYERNAQNVRLGVDSLDGRMKCKAGTYTISLKCPLSTLLYYSSNEVSTNINATTSGTKRVATFTLSEDTELFFYAYNSSGLTSADISELQLEVGSTATDYEAYTATTKTVSLPQTVYGGYLDLVSGVLTITKKYIAYDGSEDWIEQSGTFRVAAPNDGFYDGGLTACIDNCNMFLPERAGTGNNTIRRGLANIVITTNDYASLSNFTTALSNNNLQVVYPLATPTQITLANPIELTAKAGVNNVFGDTDGNTSVEYRESVQKYVDDNIAAVQALIL
mgnify:CR=1 FL=1